MTITRYYGPSILAIFKQLYRRQLTLPDFLSSSRRRLRRFLVLLEQRWQAEAVSLRERREDVDRRRRNRKLTSHSRRLLPVRQTAPCPSTWKSKRRRWDKIETFFALTACRSLVGGSVTWKGSPNFLTWNRLKGLPKPLARLLGNNPEYQKSGAAIELFSRRRWTTVPAPW